jgi:periplasmic copper chaperone A
MFRPILLAMLFAALPACSAPAGPKISAQEGWSRATGQALTAAAYVTIENRGGADQLIGVRSNIGQASLHESAMEAGVMRMRPIEPGQGMSVPSNGRLVLAPGGAHVMITGLKKPLKAGDRFTLTMLFDRSRPHQVPIMVKPATESPAVH